MSKSEVYFVHIDAHADLSIPAGTKIEDWDDKDNLYEILSSEGGIAEFILPMITQEMIRQVIWIRSPWSHQLPDGDHHFAMKNCWDERTQRFEAKVNWQCPYYIDDDSFSSFPSNTTTDCYPIHLLTCTAERDTILTYHPNQRLYDLKSPSTNPALSESPIPSGKEPQWILDICLDYFSTNNPFIEEFKKLFQSHHERKKSSLSAEEWILIVQEIYESFPYRLPISAFPSLATAAQTLQIEENIIKDVNRFKVYCRSLFSEVLFHHKSLEKFQRLFRFASEETREKIQLFLDHFSVLSEEIRCFIYHKGHLLLLPYHPVTDETEVDRRIEELQDFLFDQIVAPLADTATGDRSKLPLCVTIATSAGDEYTLPAQTESLLQKVLVMVDDLLEKLFKDSREKVEINKSEISRNKKETNRHLRHLTIHDIRQEPIEMAYQISFSGSRRRTAEDVFPSESIRNIKSKI